ncbi:hypothetical protein A2U01_0064707, partial [Trifolium medium]|nr:hypothetical protein [Trifolium medium]
QRSLVGRACGKYLLEMPNDFQGLRLGIGYALNQAWEIDLVMTGIVLGERV